MENIHCTPCNYSTKIKANFRNHLLTKSHAAKCKISLVCHKCLRKFSRQKPCFQHAANCMIDLYPKSFERKHSRLKDIIVDAGNDGNQDHVKI